MLRVSLLRLSLNGTDGEYFLYADDGESLSYQRGAFYTIEPAVYLSTRAGDRAGMR